MKFPIFQLLCLLSVPPAFAISNGVEAKGDEPFARGVVGLAYKEAQGYYVFCTGSLLNANTVVTAAHCLYARDNSYRLRGELTVIFGLEQKSPATQARKLLRKVVKEGYKPAHKNADVDILDIALAQFEGEAPEGYAPLPLLEDDSVLRDGATVILAGYGFRSLSPPSGSGRLRYTTVKIAGSSATEVAVDERRSGSLAIDSGGPGFIEIGGRYFLWGATSREDEQPMRGRYTNILPFRSWIERKLESLEGWVEL